LQERKIFEFNKNHYLIEAIEEKLQQGNYGVDSPSPEILATIRSIPKRITEGKFYSPLDWLGSKAVANLFLPEKEKKALGENKLAITNFKIALLEPSYQNSEVYSLQVEIQPTKGLYPIKRRYFLNYIAVGLPKINQKTLNDFIFIYFGPFDQKEKRLSEDVINLVDRLRFVLSQNYKISLLPLVCRDHHWEMFPPRIFTVYPRQVKQPQKLIGTLNESLYFINYPQKLTIESPESSTRLILMPTAYSGNLGLFLSIVDFQRAPRITALAKFNLEGIKEFFPFSPSIADWWSCSHGNNSFFSRFLRYV